MPRKTVIRALSEPLPVSRTRLASVVGAPGSALLEGWSDVGDDWHLLLPWPEEIREVRDGRRPEDWLTPTSPVRRDRSFGHCRGAQRHGLSHLAKVHGGIASGIASALTPGGDSRAQ